MVYEFIFRGKQPHKAAIARTPNGLLLVAVPRYTAPNGIGATSVITIDEIARQFDLREILSTFGSHIVDSTVIIQTRCALHDGEKKHPALDQKYILPFEDILKQSYNGNKIRYV